MQADGFEPSPGEFWGHRVYQFRHACSTALGSVRKFPQPMPLATDITSTSLVVSRLSSMRPSFLSRHNLCRSLHPVAIMAKQLALHKFSNSSPTRQPASADDIETLGKRVCMIKLKVYCCAAGTTCSTQECNALRADAVITRFCVTHDLEYSPIGLQEHGRREQDSNLRTVSGACGLANRGLATRPPLHLAEQVGFEPTGLLHPTVFKTVALIQTRPLLQVEDSA